MRSLALPVKLTDIIHDVRELYGHCSQCTSRSAENAGTVQAVTTGSGGHPTNARQLSAVLGLCAEAVCFT